MKPTKYAVDPQSIPSDDRDFVSQVHQIRFLSTQQLLSFALAGDRIRTLKMLGHQADALELAGGNELKAAVLVQLIERLEHLIATGFGVTAALYQVLEEKWLIKIDNFESME